MILHHAHDLEEARLIRTQKFDIRGHLTPQSTPVGENRLGRSAVQNDDRTRSRHVARLQDSSFHKGDPHGREIPGKDDAPICRWRVHICPGRSLRVPDSDVARRLENWQSIDHANHLNTRQGLDLLLETLEELNPEIVFLVGVGWEGNRGRENVVHPKTGIGPTQSGEAPDEQTGSNQEDHGEGDLENHQSIPVADPVPRC